MKRPHLAFLLTFLIDSRILQRAIGFTILPHKSVERTDWHRKQTSYDDDDDARSQFGTRAYWDDLYQGRGDFPAEEYSWYFGWENIQHQVLKYFPKTFQILCPGIGNDPILLDLIRAGYSNITAFDYSEHAIERQKDLLAYGASTDGTVVLRTMDARILPEEWTDSFDAILEKGALDAIYLSGEGNVEQAVENLNRVLRPGGILISVSGVVPESLRTELFASWEWIVDGSNALEAGCFVLRHNK